MANINYYKKGGSEVYCCLLECKKAIDTVEHVKIFEKIRGRLPIVFVRILLVTYIGQKCFVRWESKKSSLFSVQNGVRLGAVLSLILFSLYVNDLIEILRASGSGCFIGPKFFGIVAYADNILSSSLMHDALHQTHKCFFEHLTSSHLTKKQTFEGVYHTVVLVIY